MVIFHSYVSLPEGISSQNDEQSPNIPILMIFKNMFFFVYLPGGIHGNAMGISWRMEI